MGLKLDDKSKKILTYVMSFLGAVGGALQNYSAVDLFLRGIVVSFTSISKLFSGLIHALSIAGGLCNGAVNFFINVELLEGFLARITKDKKARKLTGWRKFRYYAGIFAFAMTGVLFGMMAFAFSAVTPLAILALAAGLFVAIIMTIQEVETWLQSFDETVRFLITEPSEKDKESVISDNNVLIIYTDGIYKIGFCNKQGEYEKKLIDANIINANIIKILEKYTQACEIENAEDLEQINNFLIKLDNFSQKRSLKDIFNNWWSTLTFKKACGHLIAAGNVVALSLLFTLSIVEVLIVFQVAAFPALLIGLAIAFTFGAFTEFYFYNFFLAKFCNKFDEKWEKMKSTRYAPLGYVCISTNAFVNAALTYAGVGLLSGALVMAGIALPPVGLMIGLAAVCALFAGGASFILGMDFWIRKMSPEEVTAVPITHEIVNQENPGSNDEPFIPKEIDNQKKSSNDEQYIPEKSNNTQQSNLYFFSETRSSSFFTLTNQSCSRFVL